MIAKNWLSPVALALIFAGCALEHHDQGARDHEPHAALQRADDTQCYEIRAHASADAPDQKYAVSFTPSLYIAFRTPVPWSGTRYITSLRPLVDNQAVLVQSWLYAETGQPGVTRSSGMHPNGDLLYGWAPGTAPLALGPTMGIAVREGTLLTLEHHYWNRTDEIAADASGIEVCVSAQKPERLLGVTVLGTFTISDTKAEGTCAPKLNGAVRLTHLAPQMRGQGKHMQVTLNRADGSKRVVLDADYDFAARRTYPLDGVDVGPGDTLSTTCTYAKPVRFGANSWEETCELHALHEPAGALVTNNPLSAILVGRNACMK